MLNAEFLIWKCCKTLNSWTIKFIFWIHLSLLARWHLMMYALSCAFYSSCQKRESMYLKGNPVLHLPNMWNWETKFLEMILIKLARSDGIALCFHGERLIRRRIREARKLQKAPPLTRRSVDVSLVQCQGSAGRYYSSKAQ